MIKRNTFEMYSDSWQNSHPCQNDPDTHFTCIYTKAGYIMTKAPGTTILYINERVNLK